MRAKFNRKVTHQIYGLQNLVALDMGWYSIPEPTSACRLVVLSLPARGYSGREQRRSFDLRFEGTKRGLNYFSTQARVKLLGQIRVTAWMWNAHAFDDAVCAHLLRHRKHRANQRYGQSRLLEFLAHHSAAATAGPSRGDKKNSFDAVLFQVCGNFLTDAAHDRGRTLIAGDDVIGRVEFPGTDCSFRFQSAERIQRNTIVGILVHVGDVISAMDRLPFNRFELFQFGDVV